jgi:uncharacterized protein YfaP (DUF2135 family)
MSGIRDHKLYVVTIDGEHEWYPRDSLGDVCGDKKRSKFKTTKNIVASLAEIAEAYARYWLQYSGAVLDTVTVVVDKGTEIHAFIEEHKQ